MEETVVQTEEVSDNGVYELSFILVPSFTEEKLPEAFAVVKTLVEEKGGIVLGEEFPKNLVLAYTMDKTINNKIEHFKEGFFGWVKFEAEGQAISKIDAALRLRDDVIRHLIISTVRENTIAAKRSIGVRRAPKAGTTNDAAPQMSKEEIDREIEALVEDKPAA